MAPDAFEGFARVAAAVPPVRVTDPRHNREQTLALWRRADTEGCAVVYFPELGLSAYTAGDLHLDHQLRRAALEALAWLLEQGAAHRLRPLAFVGLPLFVHPGLYNVAAAIQGGRLLGIVPKAYLPNYREFYEQRQFREGREVPPGQTIELLGQTVPFGTDLLFAAENQPELVVGVEICEDGWVHVSPSAFQASAGATVCGNLSASNFTLGKPRLRHNLSWKASDPGKCAYIYTAAGPGESSADLAFDAHAIIYENGNCLAESQRFSREAQLITADIDLELLLHERLSTGSFGSCARDNQQTFRRIPFIAHRPAEAGRLRRPVERHPFVPSDEAALATRCWEVFNVQTNALITRLQHIPTQHLILGLSGGRDSTLAALACARALDELGAPRQRLHALSMPGFGTSEATRSAARRLAAVLGADFEEEDIREECALILREQRHPAAVASAQWSEAKDGLEWLDFEALLRQRPELGDLEFENVQARVRTLRLMTRANRYGGVLVGTGDLSEKALGWDTYGGDHISMYDLNAGIPKTLVEFVVRWVALHEAERWGPNGADLRATLLDIMAMPASPELLPPASEGHIAQISEAKLGPFELHDFFLYWSIRHGTRPRRLLLLAQTAFGEEYSREQLVRWLRVFYQRFFNSQWKRDCTADGPKVGTVALSPRGDWRMPSDARVQAWLEELDENGKA